MRWWWWWLSLPHVVTLPLDRLLLLVEWVRRGDDISQPFIQHFFVVVVCKTSFPPSQGERACITLFIFPRAFQKVKQQENYILDNVRHCVSIK